MPAAAPARDGTCVRRRDRRTRADPRGRNARSAAPTRRSGCADRCIAHRNAMTVDVEDYFQVQAFAGCISPSGLGQPALAGRGAISIASWRSSPAAGVTATFFTLGWSPSATRRWSAASSPPATSWPATATTTSRADTQTPADVPRRRPARTKDCWRTSAAWRCAAIARRPSRSARAITGRSMSWPRRAIATAPASIRSRHDLYGMPDAPRVPFRPGGGALWEIPMTTVRLFGRNWPCSGGGYFRLLPYCAVSPGAVAGEPDARAGPASSISIPGRSIPDQPRVADCGRKSRFRHYTNLARMTRKLDRLLRDFAWDRMDRVFADLLAPPAAGAGAHTEPGIPRPPRPPSPYAPLPAG